MATEPTDQRLDAMAAAILPLLPLPVARQPYDSLDTRVKGRLRSIAAAAYAEAVKDPDQ